jgi:hypothetical protein
MVAKGGTEGIVLIAIATLVRTLKTKGVWGLRPQPGVPPLHPVLYELQLELSNTSLQRFGYLPQFLKRC